MLSLIKRIFTSVVLIVTLYFALINNLTLFLVLTTVGFLSLIEIYELLKKIFPKAKKKIINSYLLALIYLMIFLPQLYFFANFNYQNKLFFIYILTICIATDVGGYIFGKLLKGKKLTKISPNKTYSGLIGSYILSIIVFFYFYLEFNYSINLIILTLVISSISQIGDLFISFLKRKANIKDTGALLPGHGGILDRVDGIIFALPIGINLFLFFK
tara:strand:+ start:916 stop:1560 length:645 start_codon:yes stop_codon:yes gene_type:complete